MFVGHLAAAFGARAAEPRVRLSVAVAAAFALDMLWPILLLVGVESVRVHPGDARHGCSGPGGTLGAGRTGRADHRDLDHATVDHAASIANCRRARRARALAVAIVGGVG